MGDRPHLKKVHDSSRRKNKALEYDVPKKGDRPAYKAVGRPENWDEFAAFFSAWYDEQQDWMRWVKADLEELESKLQVSLAPPPPPEDPW